MRIVKLVLTAGVVLSTAGLAVAQDSGAEGLSENLSYATWLDSAGRAKMVVGTHVTAMEHKEKYLPVQVAVGQFGKGGEIKLTPAAFTLIDSQGNVHQVVPYDEMKKERGLMDHVQEMCRGPLKLRVGDAFPAFQFNASMLYPVEGQEWSWVAIESGWYMADVVYFPNPGDEGLEGVFTVQVQGEGMDQPVAVKVELVGKHKHD